MVWKCFLFVSNLTISGCRDLVHWPTEEFRCLDRLRVLRIKDCYNLKGTNTSSSEEETLPLSLEILGISDCNRMVSLPSNLGNLAKLRNLYVNNCGGLKVLPNGMCGLTSLRYLEFRCCQAMEEFTHGLQERLPTLESLTTVACPELGRRCIEGGEYFHLVSCVPHKRIHKSENSICEVNRHTRGCTGVNLRRSAPILLLCALGPPRRGVEGGGSK